MASVPVQFWVSLNWYNPLFIYSTQCNNWYAKIMILLCQWCLIKQKILLAGRWPWWSSPSSPLFRNRSIKILRALVKARDLLDSKTKLESWFHSINYISHIMSYSWLFHYLEKSFHKWAQAIRCVVYYLETQSLLQHLEIIEWVCV